MAKTSNALFTQRVQRVFVVMTALLAISLTYRFALDRVEVRAALHAKSQMQAAKAAAEARARMALREGARRHPASESNGGYVNNRTYLAPAATRAVPSQIDPRLLHSRPAKS